jgi:uncharacterized protein
MVREPIGVTRASKARTAPDPIPKEDAMKRSSLVIAGFLAGAVLALQVPVTAQPADDEPARRTITVHGTATITVDPDEAVLRLGVRTQADRAQEAMDLNSQKMQKVLDALRELGLGDDDLATSLIELYPRYDDRGEHVIGYDAANEVEVTVTELNAVGRVLDAAVDAGANVAGGISFRVSDASEGLDDALAEAVGDARAKAETMAAAADAGVGQVVTIVEIAGGEPGPIYAERVAYAAGDMAVPVETPTIETDVSVEVTWQLT